MHVAAIVHDPGDFGRETNRCTFEKPTGQTDGPGIEPISDLRLFGSRRAAFDLSMADGIERWLARRAQKEPTARQRLL